MSEAPCIVRWCRRRGVEAVTVEHNGEPNGVGMLCKLHSRLLRIVARRRPT